MSDNASRHQLPLASDEILLEQMRAGQMEAFTLLFKRHSRRAVELAATIAEDHFEAEEMVSDIFYSLWMRRTALPEIPLFKAYLFTAVRYQALKAANRKKAGMKIVPIGDDWEHAADATDTHTTKEQERLIDALHRAIDLLPPQRRLILKLKRLDGLSYSAIASLLEISENTVRNQLVMALKTLREHLAVSSLAVYLATASPDAYLSSSFELIFW